MIIQHNIRKIVSNKPIFTVLSACIIGAGAFVFLVAKSSFTFEHEYAAYHTLVQEQEQAAYLPAAPDNSLRQELNQTLALALVKTNTPAQRLGLAQHGLDLLQQSQKQIDTIGDLSEKVDAVVAKMQVDSLNGFSSGGSTREVIALAKKRSSIIADIRGLSYRANFETTKIFNRIIVDHGALTKEHIIVLNNEIPDVEDQFNQRQHLYDELRSTSNQIELTKEAATEGGVFSNVFSWGKMK